ncbi:YaiI/YqxD family protein [Sporomusa termitida]|uniref:UPF0178 protein SPTER_43630 n=1 Tax=Sporomusa termitida TaxID=2377 RepID=A0A517DZX7_9FIRM|nr:DUF188 domain-containing protein [Sporomusa termitida]QDR82914.1 hypothetical protein SPTER_43630 [Sporomusa termitida]
MKLLIDADACPKPALQICVRLGQKYGLPVWTVASFNHNIVSDHHVTVGGGAQEADIKIINLTEPGDIIVTQDWGLASMVLGKPAYCISPAGKVYSVDNIEFLLEERELKAKFRRGGGRTSGPRKRTEQDDQRFAAAIEQMMISARQRN